MATLSDYRTAAAMRDVMAQLIGREVEKNRPRYRYAEIVSIDASARRATVLYPGEVDPVEVPFGDVAVPEQAGQIVRIDGLVGDRFISDIVTPAVQPWELPTENWHTIGAAGEPPFLNFWSYFGAGHATPAFYKDNSGVVHLKGMITASGAGAPMFTLPVGYRPLANEHFPVISADGPGEVEVASNGTVSAIQGSNSWYSLDAIQFLAQAGYDDREDEMAWGHPINGWVSQFASGTRLTGVWQREDGLCMLHRGGWYNGTGAVFRLPFETMPREDYLYHIFGWNGAPVSERMDISSLNNALIVYATNNNRCSGLRWFSGQGFDTSQWIRVTTEFTLGWTHFDATDNQWVGARYYKDKYGVVHLHGLVKDGTMGTIFNLPAGYRPGERLLFPCHAGANIGRLEVRADGSVRLEATPVGIDNANNYLSLDNASFRAEG